MTRTAGGQRGGERLKTELNFKGQGSNRSRTRGLKLSMHDLVLASRSLVPSAIGTLDMYRGQTRHVFTCVLAEPYLMSIKQCTKCISSGNVLDGQTLSSKENVLVSIVTELLLVFLILLIVNMKNSGVRMSKNAHSGMILPEKATNIQSLSIISLVSKLVANSAAIP